MNNVNWSYNKIIISSIYIWLLGKIWIYSIKYTIIKLKRDGKEVGCIIKWYVAYGYNHISKEDARDRV